MAKVIIGTGYTKGHLLKLLQPFSDDEPIRICKRGRNGITVIYISNDRTEKASIVLMKGEY
jgi:hypothetical protein